MRFGRNKYGNTRTVVDGISFMSKDEAAYYQTLKAAKENGHIRAFTLQPRFKFACGVTYVADFAVIALDWTVKVVDCKGHETKDFIIKKKLYLHEYGPLTIVKPVRRAGLIVAWDEETLTREAKP